MKKILSIIFAILVGTTALADNHGNSKLAAIKKSAQTGKKIKI